MGPVHHLARLLYFLNILGASHPRALELIYVSFPDNTNTASSIKALSEYGFFGEIPTLMEGEADFFGGFPPLFASIGALFNLFLNDPPWSTFLTTLLVGLGIAYLLSIKFLRTLDWRAKLILVSAVLVLGITFSFFPFTSRARELLAILIGLFLFSFNPEKTPAGIAKVALLSFLLFTAHIHASIFFAALYFLFMLEKSRSNAYLAIPLAIGAILSFPFYIDIFQTLFLPPSTVGCSLTSGVTLAAFLLGYALLLFAAFLILTGRRLGITETAILAMLLAPLILFLGSGLGALGMHALARLFFFAQAQVCSETYILVAFSALLATSASRQMPQNALICLMLMLILNFVYSPIVPIMLSSEKPAFQDILYVLEENNVTKAGTAVFYEFDGDMKYEFPMHRLIDYAFIKNSSIVFVDTNLTPQLSKSKNTLRVSALFHAIHGQDRPGCKNLSAALKSEGVDGIVFTVLDANPDLPEKMQDRELLLECGLEEVSPYSNVFVYEIR